jgi:hypothetical protein
MPGRKTVRGNLAPAMNALEETRAPRLPVVLCAAALAVLVVWLAVVVARPLATDDLWFHMKMGEVYSSEGLWPDADPMLHTAGDRTPVQHEWLFGVAVHFAQRAVGFQGLRVLHLLAVLGIVALVATTLHGRSPSLAATAAATAAFLAVSWWRLIQLRPDLVSIPATILFYRLVLAPRAGPSWTRVGGAVLLVWVWANMHSLYGVAPALGLAALAGLALDAWLRAGSTNAPRSGQMPGRVALAIALCTLASLVNPRGLDQLLTFFSSSTEAAIWFVRDEWAHFDPFTPPGATTRGLTLFTWLGADAVLVISALVAVIGGLGLVRARARGARPIDPVLLALAAAGVVALLVSVRFLWMSFFSLLFVLDALARRGPRARQAWSSAVVATLLVLGFATQDVWSGFLREVRREPGGYFGARYLSGRYAGPGVRFLAEAGLEGRLFNPYHVGGYAGYWLAPKVRTFIDGRTEHYPPEVANDYFEITRGATPEQRRKSVELLDQYEVDLFLAVGLPEGYYGGLNTRKLLANSRTWVPVFRSLDHTIYARRGSGTKNLTRVEDYYRESGVPFERKQGFDTAAVVEHAPEWATAAGLIPRDFEALRARAEDADLDVRLGALARLGKLYWHLELRDDQVPADEAALALDPRRDEIRLRLGSTYLRQGRVNRAASLAREALAFDPGDERFLSLLDAAR